MKKNLSKIILFLVLILIFVVSCGKKSTTDEIPTIKVISVGGGMPKNYASWKEKADKYLEEKIGVHIDVEVISWGDWDRRRNVIASANEPFDILFANLNTYDVDVTTGLFLDITDMLEKPEFKQLKDLIPEKYWQGVKINGRIYAVPTYKDSSVTQYFIMDKKIVDKYNVDIASKHELYDFDSDFYKITKDTGQPIYIFSMQGADEIFLPYDRFGLPFNVLGVRYDDKDMKVVNILETPEIMKDLEYLHKWYKDGIINKDAPTASENPKYRPFFIAQGWPLAAKTAWGPGNGGEVEISKYRETILSNGTVRGSLNGISASSDHPEKALELLQLINTDSKFRDMMAYGEEGVNFDYVQKFGETRVKKGEGYTDWTMATYTQGQFFNLTITDEVEENQWDEVKKLNEEAKASVLLGFSFNPEPVQDEIANVLAVYNKYKSELLAGVHEPHAKVKQIIEEMNKAGLNKIIEESQKQIDEFKKTK